MPRLANKSYTARAPDGAGSWPEIPDLDPQLSEIDGGKTNAALQRWNDLVRARLGGNEQQDNGRFKNIQTTIDRQDGYLESVWTMQAIAGPVVTGMTLFSSVDPTLNTTVSRITLQADVFQIQTASGNHKQIFSTAADAIKLGDVLTVDLANAKVFIGTGTYGNANTAFYVDDDGFFSLKNKLTFDPTGTGTLTITGTIVAAAGSIGGWLIGATYIIDAAGLVGMSSAVTGADDIRFWAGNLVAGSAPFRVTEAGVLTASSGTVGGWTLSATTLSANNVVISNAGTIALGTTTNILIMSSVGVYRLWAGDTVAATAAFSVSQTGALFSTSGTIGGFTITASTLASTNLHFDVAGFLTVGPTSGGQATAFSPGTVQMSNAAGTNVIWTLANDASDNGILTIYDFAHAARITLNGATGVITATSYAGSGAALTGLSAGQISGLAASATTNALNASNISSGTLANARLPSTLQLGDGSTGAPTYSFASDTDTGWRWNSSGDMRGVTNGADRLVIRDGAIVLIVPLKFETAVQAIGAKTVTGFITAQDSSGGTINLAVAT